MSHPVVARLRRSANLECLGRPSSSGVSARPRADSGLGELAPEAQPMKEFELWPTKFASAGQEQEWHRGTSVGSAGTPSSG